MPAGDGSLLLPGGRLLLVAVFALAGTAKLADLPGSRRALTGFGVPLSLAGPLGLLLPIGELAVVLALLWPPLVWAGAAGAAVLALVFSAAIGGSLWRGVAPSCHCFGQVHSRPAGWPTLLRNVGLLVVAATVAVAAWRDPGPDPLAWFGPPPVRLAALLCCSSMRTVTLPSTRASAGR